MKLLLLTVLAVAVIHSPIMASAATCTGSGSCKACKNCKNCKHCAKEGGSCGVCSGNMLGQDLSRRPISRAQPLKTNGAAGRPAVVYSTSSTWARDNPYYGRPRWEVPFEFSGDPGVLVQSRYVYRAPGAVSYSYLGDPSDLVLGE
jgi:hypothetical protein